MKRRSIEAYDLPGRVATYDADMEVMHPNRTKMVQVALDILPFSAEEDLRVLDLGVGTGYFSHRLLERFPKAHVTAVDGAAEMVDLARARLGDLAARMDFRIGDFRDLSSLLPEGESFDCVITSYALHHLDGPEKEEVIRVCVQRMRTGAWFVNADVITGNDDTFDDRFQALRVAGIVGRAEPGDDRFADAKSTRRFLDDLEEGEGDQPRTLFEDLATHRAAGLDPVTPLWVEYREAVIAGIK